MTAINSVPCGKFDSPDIDFVVAPGNYSDRVPGGASGSQCAYGSAFLRGKRLLRRSRASRTHRKARGDPETFRKRPLTVCRRGALRLRSRQRTLCNAGRTLVFAYAPGLSDGKTLDIRRVRDWAGVAFGTPGVSVTDRGTWKAAYAADPAFLTSVKLAELYTDAGVHRYVDELSPVYANTRLVAVHSATGGVKQIRFRTRVREAVELLSESTVLHNGERLKSVFETPDTKIFELIP